MIVKLGTFIRDNYHDNYELIIIDGNNVCTYLDANSKRKSILLDVTVT